ncbi:hypothetical protein [Arthrobacter sp. HS15c]|uniref:hypothetical protein n=1 Tax=Arthrobacter sp. HS15c TaxID=3230279 RepID=UPI00346587CC
MNTATAEHVEVRVDSARQIEERLNAAVKELQPLAASARHGILVTRLNPGHYTISLSEDVPFGLTRERTR